MTDPMIVTKILSDHRQNHDPDTGASTCECGWWDGPFTMLPSSDERSYAHHLTQELEAAGVFDDD